MLTFKSYLTESKDILHHFWDEHESDLPYYHQRDNCTTAARDLDDWMSKNRPGVSRGVVPSGSYDSKGNPKKGGFIRVDKPQYGKDDLHPADKEEMSLQNLDHRKAADRKKFVTEHPDKEKFHWIPHSWVDTRQGKLDPSGFHPSGTGQFDKLIKDKKAAQYKEFGE